MEYHENIIGFTSIVLTSSMDIVSITNELSKDYIENLRNSSYLKIGFIMVKIVCMSEEFNRNGEFKNFKASLYSEEKHFLFDNYGIWLCGFLLFCCKILAPLLYVSQCMF